ncbi:hypothetical protein Dimus_037763 [Dionaea muscipula]
MFDFGGRRSTRSSLTRGVEYLCVMPDFESMLDHEEGNHELGSSSSLACSRAWWFSSFAFAWVYLLLMLVVSRGHLLLVLCMSPRSVVKEGARLIWLKLRPFEDAQPMA